MHRYEPFRCRTAEELLNKAGELGIQLPWKDEIAPLFLPFHILGKKVPNRIAVQPMEGCDGATNGAPEELTFRRYRRYAQGGNGLIWFEACSVSAAGRSNPRQLQLTGNTLGAFQRLVSMTRKAAHGQLGASFDPYLVLQITHSGRFSRRQTGCRKRAARLHPLFDPSWEDVELYQDGELEEIRDQFVSAAILAQQAGFDAVDIKACHGYLLHELLSAFTRADSRYGGSFECRTRLLLEIVRLVRQSAPRLALAVRMNATDGIPYPYGFGMDKNGTGTPDLSEPLRLQQLLMDAGCALLNISAGIPYWTPHLGRPYNRPARGAQPAEFHPMAATHALIQWAALFQEARRDLPVVGTGYSWLQRFWPNVGAAVVARKQASAIGLGRSSLAYPDAPLDLMTLGKLDPRKCCIACSCCTELMRYPQTTGCVIRDAAIYKMAYQSIGK